MSRRSRNNTYVAYISKRRDNLGPIQEYDILVSSCDYQPEGRYSRNIIKTIKMTSEKFVMVDDLTQYIRWKFSTCSVKTCRESKRWLFIRVAADINWLINIIETEFDYHVGKGDCKKNKEYFSEYCKSPYAGYGAKYYDKDNPISESRLHKIMHQFFDIRQFNKENADRAHGRFRYRPLYYNDLVTCDVITIKVKPNTKNALIAKNTPGKAVKSN